MLGPEPTHPLELAAAEFGEETGLTVSRTGSPGTGPANWPRPTLGAITEVLLGA